MFCSMEIQLNLDKICRLCLEEKCEQLQDVFGNESNLCESIYRVTTVKIQQGDGLPAHVCEQCISQVNTLVNFQRKCVVTNLALHHYVRQCICHKEHKECEAVKLNPRDPLQLTQVVKTEGGPCQIKSETRVFQLQESQDEVITGIIEEGSSDTRVGVKPEESESSIKTSMTVKAKQTNGRRISINSEQTMKAKIHKRRRRKGHHWIIKKQSLVNRKRASGVCVRNTRPLQNTEICTAEASIQDQQVPQTINFFPVNNKLMSESGPNRLVSLPSSSFIAAKEGLSNAMSSSPSAVSKRTTEGGYVLKTRKSGNSNSDSPQNKRALQNNKMVIINKKAAEKNPQNKTSSQNNNAIATNKKTEQNLQNKQVCQNSSTVTVSKKTASKECQQRASDSSKTNQANKKSHVQESTSSQIVSEKSSPVLANQKLVTEEHIQTQTKKSLSRKPSTQNSNPTVNKNPEMEARIQIERLPLPIINMLRKKTPLEEPTPIQMMQQSCNSVQSNQNLKAEEYKKPQTKDSATKKLPQSIKSVQANQKLVPEDRIQKESPVRKSSESMAVAKECPLNENIPIPATEKLIADKHLQIQRRKSIPKRQATVESTPSQKVAPKINSLIDHKLVAEVRVHLQKVSPLRDSFTIKPSTKESTLSQSMQQTSKSLTDNQKQHAQTGRLSLNRSTLKSKSVTGEHLRKGTFPTNKTPETEHSSETYQGDKLALEEDCDDTLSANENLRSNNTVSTKRKISETESSAPELLGTKKQKIQENDRLTKLVIQVEGNKLCCSQCDSWFDDVEKLKQHLKELHNKRVVRWHTVTNPAPEKDVLPSLQCTSCDKQFTSQRLLTLHQTQKSCL